MKQKNRTFSKIKKRIFRNVIPVVYLRTK